MQTVQNHASMAVLAPIYEELKLRLVVDYGRSNYHAPNMEAARGRLLDDSHDPCLTLKVEGKKKAHRSGRGPGQGSSC